MAPNLMGAISACQLVRREAPGFQLPDLQHGPSPRLDKMGFVATWFYSVDGIL